MNYATTLHSREKTAYLAQALKEHGESPHNTFKVLREEQGMTLEELGRSALLSKQALIRCEQGVFNQPLPTLMDYWVSRGFRELWLQEGYEDYQAKMRERHQFFFGVSLAVSTTLPTHPFKQLRETYNWTVSEVAKYICMPQSTLAYWEKRWISQQSVPKDFIDICLELGYSKSQVNYFCRDYAEWRNLNRGLLK